jgi:hypothetical protein
VKNLKHGTLIAIAAGGLFLSGCKKDETKAEAKKEEAAPAAKPEDKPATPTADTAGSGGVGVAAPTAGSGEKISKIDCAGVNECKGKGTCKQETHGCGGQNECKGKGVLEMTEDECKAKGGTVVANK